MQIMKVKREIRYLVIFMLAMLTFVMGPAYAFITTKPLDADKAFEVSVIMDGTNKAIVHWEIAKGYYLYRQKLQFVFEPKVVADISLPQGEVKQDLRHAQYETYTGVVNIPIALRTEAQKIQMTINYQGCSEKGFCYPPMHKSMTLDLVANTTTATKWRSANKPTELANIQTLLTNQNDVQALLGSQNMPVMLLIFMGLGLLLAFTPCVFPMIPILTAIIIGHKQPVSTSKAFLLSLTYVLGSSITYAIAGMTAAYMGGSLQASLQQPWILAIVSGLFVLLSMSLFGVYDLQLPRSFQNRITSLSRKQQGGTYVGVFIIGAVSTLIVSPCVTAPLVGVLMYIAQSGNMALGAGALFAMGLGMGIPLILIGMSAGKWLPRKGLWMIGVQRIFGVMMLGMAVWLLSRVATATTIMTFVAVLLLGAAIFFGVYRSHGRLAINRCLGVTSGIAALFLIIAVNTPSVINAVSNAKSTESAFITVRNVDEIRHQISLAQASGKPVMLDFYADWCESCVVMDKKVFTLPDVIHGLNKFVLLRADLSRNSVADEIMLKSFEVVAPPTVLFFNNYGQEVNSRRIVGELNAMEFMSRVNTFITASCDKNLSC